MCGLNCLLFVDVFNTPENLGEYQVESIRDHDTIDSIWEDGEAPFVSVEDIAELVYRRLVDWKIWNYDVIIHGPELFSNDEVCLINDLFIDTLWLRYLFFHSLHVSSAKLSAEKSRIDGFRKKSIFSSGRVLVMRNWLGG